MSVTYLPVPGVVYVGHFAPRPRTPHLLFSAALGLVALSMTAEFTNFAPPAPRNMPRVAAVSPKIEAPAAVVHTDPPKRTARVRPDAATTDLVFGRPVALAPFGPAANHAPALQAELSVRQAPPVAAPLPPVRVASMPSVEEPAEVAKPVPPHNPFRLKGVPKTAEQPATQAPTASAPAEPAKRTIVARAPAAAAAPAEEKGFFEKIFSGPAQGSGPALAYARTEDESLSRSPLLPRPAVESKTAIYDIENKVVILPSGRRLEAHSGLGQHLDDPASRSLRMRGVTPPGTYNLRMREALFHGVRAIRLLPTDDTRMFGRDGILAHTFMLGPRGDSNGCVSFRDYDQFLAAFQRGEVTRMVVVANSSALPTQTASRY